MSVLTLPPTLTLATATACLRELGAALLSESTVVEVDATPLVQFDSAALAVLLALRRQALTRGRTFRLLGCPSRLVDLAGLYGIAELLSAPST